MNSKSQKHIALISVHGDPAAEIGKEEAGGQNVYVRHVGEALANLGWTVDMFTRSSGTDLPDIVEHSKNCRTIRLVAGPQKFIPRDNIFEYAPLFVEQLLQYQQKTGVDYKIVHTNYWIASWVGMELKKIQGTQQVHTYHSLGAVKYDSLGAVKYKSASTIPPIAKKRLEVEKTVLETAETIIATSPQEKEHMRSLVSTKGNISIIPCGTDIHRFGSITKQQARNQLGIPKDLKVVLYVGRFDPRKGIETLVRAVAQSQVRANEDIKLIIGGGSRPGESDGIERDRIESIVAELGMSDFTDFPGRIGDDLLAFYYAAADVCVVPSHYEPFGLVAIEAMASGTPVVASDVGGLQFTVVPEETGLLAQPLDENAFAAAIDRILLNPEWANQLGKAARKRVESKFSWEGVASQLSQLYTKLLEKDARGQTSSRSAKISSSKKAASA